MKIDAHRVGLIVFTLGVIDVALLLWMPLLWKYVASPSSDIISFPLFTVSPNPLAIWLQSVFVGAILAVRGAFIYTKRTRIATGVVLSFLSVLFVLSSMLSFANQNYSLSLILFLFAILLFGV